jgi:hypothetical protein
VSDHLIFDNILRVWNVRSLRLSRFAAPLEYFVTECNGNFFGVFSGFENRPVLALSSGGGIRHTRSLFPRRDVNNCSPHPSFVLDFGSDVDYVWTGRPARPVWEKIPAQG